MAGVTLDKLPPATGFVGNELLWIYQQGPTQITPWIGLRCTLSQVAAYISNPGGGTYACTMRQLVAELASQNLLNTVLLALPSDPNNSYNIAWFHGRNMGITDPFSTGFLQPTLGYSTNQMQNLYTFALAFPA